MLTTHSKNVCIIGANESLQTLLQRQSIPHTNITLYFYRTIRHHALLDMDIIILKNQFIYVSNIKNKIKEGARVVLCVFEMELSQLKPQEFELFDEIFFLTYSNEQFAYVYTKYLTKVIAEEELLYHKNILDTLINSIPDLVWIKNIDGAHLKVNDSFCKAVGKSKDDIEGKDHYSIWDISKDEYDKGQYVCLESEEEVICKKKLCIFDELVDSKQGLRQFRTYKAPIIGAAGNIIGTIGIAHDVTDIKNIVKELDIILSNLPFGYLIVGTDDKIIKCNMKFCEMLNIDDSHIVGSIFTEFIENNFCNNINFLYDNETEIAYKNNKIGSFLILVDITQEKNNIRKLKLISETDALTGLYNRRYLRKFIVTNYDAVYCIMYFDINDFKIFNDEHGHSFGDNILVEFSAALKLVFDKHLCVRAGGDEFIVCLLKKYTNEEIYSLLYNLKNKLFFLNICISCGVSFNDKRYSFTELLNHADSAMYYAKSNKIFFKFWNDNKD